MYLPHTLYHKYWISCPFFTGSHLVYPVPGVEYILTCLYMVYSHSLFLYITLYIMVIRTELWKKQVYCHNVIAEDLNIARTCDSSKLDCQVWFFLGQCPDWLRGPPSVFIFCYLSLGIQVSRVWSNCLNPSSSSRNQITCILSSIPPLLHTGIKNLYIRTIFKLFCACGLLC